MATSWSIGGATYSNRLPVVFDSSPHISSDLSDQTNRVHFTNALGKFWDNSPPVNGGGVRYADESATTIYDFEVESYDTIGKDAWWHVEIDTLLAASDTTIYIYFNVDSETDGSNRTGTWDSVYKQVLHGNPDSDIGAFADSTSNGIGMTNDGSTVRTGEAMIDKGWDFDGTNDGVFGDTIGELSAALHGAAAITTECAVRWDDLTGQDTLTALILSAPPAGLFGGNLFRLADDTMRVLGRSQNADSNQISISASTVSINTNYHMIMITDFANDTNTLIVNGSKWIDADAVSYGLSAYNDANDQEIPDGIGYLKNPTPTQFTNGGIDEVTYSATARSDDWYAARYQSWLGDWMTVGELEPVNGNNQFMGANF